MFSLSSKNVSKNNEPDFDYPQKVSATALSDLNAALKSGDGEKTVDALVRYSIAKSNVSKDNMANIIDRIDSVKAIEKRPEYKALLNYFEALVFSSYCDRYNRSDRKNPEGQVPADYSEWDEAQFHKKITELVTASLSDVNALKQQPITKFGKIINCDKNAVAFFPTLFDFLSYQGLELVEDDTAMVEKIYDNWEAADADNIPALIFVKNYRINQTTEDEDDNEAKFELYSKYKDNEYCGLPLGELENVKYYSALKDYVSKFPSSRFSNQVRNDISSIESKYVHVSYPTELSSNDSIEVTASVENVNSFKINVYRIPWEMYNDKRIWQYNLSKLTLVDSRDVAVQGTVPFNDTTKVMLKPLPYGAYIIAPSFSNGGSTVADKELSKDELRIHDIYLFKISEKSGPNRVFAVDMKTGEPRSNVTITGKKFSGKTDANGALVIPNNVRQDNFMPSIGKDVYGSSLYYSTYESYDNSMTTASTFTDLSIYRPGETVNFGAIVYYANYTTRKVLSNEKITAKFCDHNNKEIDSVTLVTDEYGRISSSFKIPTDRMNGTFWIKFSRGSKDDYFASATINVSEYKTPTFTVTFPDSRISYTKDQPVKISGKVATYSGVPVADTEVIVTLKRNTWSWWWWRSSRNNGKQLESKVLKTDKDGNFTIEFPASTFIDEKDEFFYSYYNCYTVEASCTNSAGETQSQQQTFVIGNHHGVNFLQSEGTYLNEAAITLPLQFNSTDENEKSVDCEYTLTNAESGKIAASGTVNTAKPVFNFTSVPSGEYKLEVNILNEKEATKAEMNIVLYHASDKRSPVKSAMWIPECGRSVDNKNVAHITIGTSTPESHIYYIVSSRTKVLEEGWLHYKAGMHELKAQIPNATDEYITVELHCTHDNKALHEKIKMTSAINNDSLSIKVNSFRDKLIPGEKEKWSFQLVGKNNTPRSGVMLLEMFDKAISDISNNSWSFSPQYVFNYPVSFSYSSMSGATNQSVSWTANNLPTPSFDIPSFNLYDQPLFNSGRFGGNMMMLNEAAPPMAMMKMQSANSSDLEEVRVAGVTSKAKVSEDAASGTYDEAKANANLNKVQLRESDVKTALWKPTLTSDASGNISIEFEAPQFNTTWIMQAIAYTSNLVTDKITREVVTKKHLMVKSSVPRFVRQGDDVTLAATVQNSTDKAIACKAVIELFDPRSGKIYSTQEFNENLDANGTKPVSVAWNVPDSIPFVGFRIKAANDNFSDGEQVMIPVLPAISPVIETNPFYIDAATPQYSLTLPDFPEGSRVTLEYCDNPVWYCITALPTIFSDNYFLATSLAHNLFAITLAQGIAKAQPQTKQAIDYWKANAQDSTLVSMLARNKDLKIGTLLASPWVRDADRQTLRMSKLSELFDEKLMKEEHNKIVTALSSMQNGDGGWPWFQYPGCPSSLYTTEEVLELIGEVQHLGYLTDDATVNAMVKMALRYYDAEIMKIYREQLKHKSVNYASYSNYVYIRTLFPSIKPSTENEALINKSLNAMTTSWKGLPLMDKAFYAMALNRNNHQNVARNIVESIRQFAITKPATGMYWDNLQSGWWYFDKVAVTSTILEAFNEIDPRTAEIDQIRKWMLLQKQSNDWGTSSLAADAVYALLSTGSKWLERNGTPQITLDYGKMEFDKMDAYLGYARKTIPAHSKGIIKIERNGNSPAWGAVYCQYKAPMTSIKEYKVGELSISKDFFVYSPDGTLHAATELKVGDKVQVRTVIKNSKDLDYVTVTDERGACFEPVDRFSGHRYADHSFYYLETKDAATNIFFTDLQKGTHVISYDVYVTAPGSYSAGIATAQCQYAPQIAAHSAGKTIIVK
jgi:hypothetical protein